MEQIIEIRLTDSEKAALHKSAESVKELIRVAEDVGLNLLLRFTLSGAVPASDSPVRSTARRWRLPILADH